MPGILEAGRLGRLALVTVLVLLQGLAAAAAAFATRALFMALHEGAALPGGAMAVLGGSGAVIALARVAARLQGERIGQDYALAVRRALFEHGASMAQGDVATRRAGYVAMRFVGDLSALRNWPGVGVPRLIAGALLLPLSMAVLARLHLPFFWGVLPLYGAAVLAMAWGGRALPALHRRLRVRRAAIAADMAERMPIAPQLSALGRRGAEARRIEKRSERMIVAALARVRCAEALRAIPDVMAGLAALVVVVLGVRGGASAATIAAGLAALGIALGPLRDMATIWNSFAAYRIAREKCAAALERPRRALDGRARLPRRVPVSVALEGLRLGGRAVLEFAVPAGGRVCLRGPNGSGKSRLLRMIAGLEQAQSGQVVLAGQPLASLSEASRGARVALISAEPAVLRGSLRRALSMGLRKRPDDARILQVATRFGLGDLIAARGGLDGEVAEGGRDLSDGQRIRLSIVRAALARPGLVLVDGVAERLDAAGQAALRRWLRRHKATLIVAEAPSLAQLGHDATWDLAA